MSITIYDLDIEQLSRLKRDVDVRLAELEAEAQSKRLEAEIEQYGYALRKEVIQSNYNYLVLSLNVKIYTMNIHDTDDSDDWHMYSNAFDIEQPPWTERINTWDSADFGIEDVDDVDNWEHGDWDDPAVGIGTVSYCLYYKRHSKPSSSITVEAINEDGDIITLNSDDYTEAEWNQLQVCILS